MSDKPDEPNGSGLSKGILATWCQEAKLMKNAVQPDQDSCEPHGTDVTAGATGYVSSRRLIEDQALERPALVKPPRKQHETTDPLRARLPHDVISEMEAELKQQVDRLVAERH
ncbi:hypothetical protein [Bradyrhizobium sp. Pha-3]|uniref:hypothetical protein n=1 Tax=Bradyrhizobium TaxID=374 RepID=UPI0035D49C1D